MRLKPITICPIAMDTENCAAAFYYLKAVMSQRCPLFARQKKRCQITFSACYCSPLVSSWPTTFLQCSLTNAEWKGLCCTFCRLCLYLLVDFFIMANTVDSCSVYDPLKPADLSCKTAT